MSSKFKPKGIKSRLMTSLLAGAIGISSIGNAQNRVKPLEKNRPTHIVDTNGNSEDIKYYEDILKFKEPIFDIIKGGEDSYLFLKNPQLKIQGIDGKLDGEYTQDDLSFVCVDTDPIVTKRIYRFQNGKSLPTELVDDSLTEKPQDGSYDCYLGVEADNNFNVFDSISMSNRSAVDLEAGITITNTGGGVNGKVVIEDKKEEKIKTEGLPLNTFFSLVSPISLYGNNDTDSGTPSIVYRGSTIDAKVLGRFDDSRINLAGGAGLARVLNLAGSLAVGFDLDSFLVAPYVQFLGTLDGKLTSLTNDEDMGPASSTVFASGVGGVFNVGEGAGKTHFELYPGFIYENNTVTFEPLRLKAGEKKIGVTGAFSAQNPNFVINSEDFGLGGFATGSIEFTDVGRTYRDSLDEITDSYGLRFRNESLSFGPAFRLGNVSLGTGFEYVSKDNLAPIDLKVSSNLLDGNQRDLHDLVGDAYQAVGVSTCLNVPIGNDWRVGASGELLFGERLNEQTLNLEFGHKVLRVGVQYRRSDSNGGEYNGNILNDGSAGLTNQTTLRIIWNYDLQNDNSSERNSNPPTTSESRH